MAAPNAYFTGTFLHGVERTDIPNPYPGYTYIGALGFGAVTNQISRIKVRVVSTSFLGVTVWYAPPPGYVYLGLLANQTGIASGTATPIAWTEQRIAPSGSIAHTLNATGITFSRSGLIEVNWTVAFVSRAPAAGDAFGGYISDNAAARYGEQRVGCQSSTDTISSTSIIETSVAVTLTLNARQANAAAAARDVVGPGSIETVLRARYVDCLPTTSDTATMAFVPNIPPPVTTGGG